MFIIQACKYLTPEDRKIRFVVFGTARNREARNRIAEQALEVDLDRLPPLAGGNAPEEPADVPDVMGHIDPRQVLGGPGLDRCHAIGEEQQPDFAERASPVMEGENHVTDRADALQPLATPREGTTQEVHQPSERGFNIVFCDGLGRYCAPVNRDQEVEPISLIIPDSTGLQVWGF
jgi:hypothetical protein